MSTDTLKAEPVREFLAWLQRRDRPMDRYHVTRVTDLGAIADTTTAETEALVAAWLEDTRPEPRVTVAWLDEADVWLAEPEYERDEYGTLYQVDGGGWMVRLDLVVTWSDQLDAERHPLGEFFTVDRDDLDWTHPEVAAALERATLSDSLSGLDLFTMPDDIAA